MSISRDNIKQLAANIELLAKEVQTQLDKDQVNLLTANELAKQNMTFVFSLGEFYGLQGKKSIKATRVKSGNWHNLRDSKGRFTRK